MEKPRYNTLSADGQYVFDLMVLLCAEIVVEDKMLKGNRKAAADTRETGQTLWQFWRYHKVRPTGKLEKLLILSHGHCL